MFTILLYISTFIVSTFFFFLYENNNQKGKLSARINVIKCFLLLFSILVPCIIAALRHPVVGPDSYVYVIPNYLSNSCYQENGFWSFFSNMGKETELGFAVLLYIGIMCDNIGVSYFLIQFFTLLPIAITLKKLQKNGPIWIGWLLYLFLSYNFSLSGMRTSIAISILPLSIYYFVENKFFKSFLLFVLAFLFHSSALLVYPVMLLVVVLSKKKNKKWLFVSFGLLFVSLFNIRLFFVFLLPMLNQLQARYSWYLTEYIGQITWSDIPLTDFLSKSIIIGIVAYFVYKLKQKDNVVFILLFLTIIGRFFVLYNAVFYESMRLAFYFDVYIIFLAPIVVKRFKNNFGNQMLASLIVITPAFLYWFYFIIYKGAYYTIPYILR